MQMNLMRYFERETITMFIVILMLVALAALGKKLEDGYCVSQGRILEDEEMIVAALNAIIRQEELKPGTGKEYLKRNPNCCSVNRHPDRRMLIDILTRDNFSEVEINYKVPDYDKKHIGAEFYMSRSSVSTCGKFIREAYGMSTSTLEKAR
jgi:hypothetical protein